MPELVKQDKTPILRFSFLMREDIRQKVNAYCDYLDPDNPAEADYVVSEGLNALFKRDKKFADFWEEHKAEYKEAGKAPTADARKGRPVVKKAGA